VRLPEANAGLTAAAEAPAASSAGLPARAVHAAVLNAVLRACALQGSLERAFATFAGL